MTIEFILFWPTAPGHVIYPKVWLVCPRGTPLEKAGFSFAGHHQLWIVSCLGTETWVHVLVSVLRPHPAWTRAVLVHAAIVCAHVCVSPAVSGRHCFLGVFHDLRLVAIFPPPLLCSSWASRGKALMRASAFHLGLSAPKSLTVFTLSTCGSVCLFPYAARKGHTLAFAMLFCSLYSLWTILLMFCTIIHGWEPSWSPYHWSTAPSDTHR